MLGSRRGGKGGVVGYRRVRREVMCSEKRGEEDSELYVIGGIEV